MFEFLFMWSCYTVWFIVAVLLSKHHVEHIYKGTQLESRWWNVYASCRSWLQVHTLWNEQSL